MPVVFPDELAVFRGYLVDSSTVTAVVDGRVHVTVPAERSYPFVWLSEVGGGRRTVVDRVARFVFDLHCYGDPDASNPNRSAWQVAANVHAAALAASGWIDADRHAVILDVDEIVGPRPMPDGALDAEHPLPRWLSTVAVSLRPNP